MRSRVRYIVVALALVAVGIAAALFFVLHKRPLRPEAILAAYRKQPQCERLSVDYPLDGTLFPPEFAPPTFRWQDGDGAGAWLVSIEFQDGGQRLDAITQGPQWTPSEQQWEAIKRRSLDRDARVTVVGVAQGSPTKVLSAASIAIRTSRDEVGAPLFYREVNLPFIDAVNDPSHIRWRFGTVSATSLPPIVLEGLPVCGNCHSFSADGSILGMDVDYANDKGSYAIVQVKEHIVLSKDKVMTWSDYRREDGDPTFGLLSQVSPDGRYAVSTVKDRSVFVPTPGLEFSQLFFPIKGILVVYDRQTGEFRALPGADDKEFVQSNPTWSPDGRYIIFARSKVYPVQILGDKVLLGKDECREFLEEGKTFLFDLYRIPFNGGEGGVAEPLAGASADGMSNYFARYSPDGKWIVFCKAKSFMLLQPDSELYIMPAAGGTPRRMRCNTPRMNSWHSWSPNGRWLVFSSKVNGPYTQLCLTHVDEEGSDTPPVLLANLTSSDRAANIPEFVNTSPEAISKMREHFIDEYSMARVHNNLGTNLATEGRIAEAIAHFTEAARLDPSNALARFNLGVSMEREGELEEAIEYYREAIRLDPTHEAAHNNLGIALVKQGEFDEAIEHFTRALEINPTFEKARANLEEALRQRQEHDKQ